MKAVLMRSAILLITFNRPEPTKRVIEALRGVRPSRIYIASDGPRAGRADDVTNIAAVRALTATIDWECEVKTLFRERNVGCREGPASAIDWFFSHESEGIILEDDCLPAESFFQYCDELLERFRDDERIAQICGSAFVPSPVPDRDYWFSKYADIWGWATWRRAWSQVDLDMADWPAWRDRGELARLPGATPAFIDYWTHLFDVTYDGRLADCWDFQWMLTCWQRGWLSIVPRVSQITNIGFDGDATHTSGYDRLNPAVRTPSGTLTFPLRHNDNVRTYPSAERAHGRIRYSLSAASEGAARARQIPILGNALVASVKMVRATIAKRG
ncbi:hypothetical protein [Sphingomonas sp. DC2300-3]|uniref:hypothetical protein n=1 Tax=unclassified Sphingomonas TaxID=196159 RepID=UPI003CF5FB9C